MIHRTGDETSPIPGVAVAMRASTVIDEARAWRFEGFEFDLRRGELRGPDGRSIPLRPKAEMLLRQFLMYPGHLLTRDHLLAALWPKVVVTDDSLVQCVRELRAVLGDPGQAWIRTVPRRGYRWEAKVDNVVDEEGREAVRTHSPIGQGRSARVGAEAASPPGQFVRLQASVRGRRGLMLVAAAVASLAAAMTPSSQSVKVPVHIDEEIAARGAVAVMSFVAAADDPGLRKAADSVADGITEQISRRIGMRAIGRAATLAYDGAAPPLARMASALKARYVVTGRAARADAGQRVVIGVQLVAADSGEVLWARHFDFDGVNDAGAALDVGQHVANAVRTRGGKPDRTGAASAARDADAVSLTLQGWREIDAGRSEDLRQARAHFKSALREDPGSVIALNGLAASYSVEAGNPSNRLTAEQTAEEEQAVNRARRLAPDDATALLLWGNFQLGRGNADLALPAIEKAIRLVPSYANGHALLAKALLLLGRTDEVQAAAERAISLGEGDARRVSRAYAIAAEAALMRGEDQRAYDMAARSVAALPSNPFAHASLGAIDALTGRTNQAALEIANLLKLWPSATVASYDHLHPSTNPVYLAQRERLYEGLRRAGLPQQ